MESEARSVEVAVQLRAAYARSGLAVQGVEAAIARLEDDERAHVALCRAFVAAIGWRPIPDPHEAAPAPDEDPPSLALLRWVLTGLAICETVSALRFAMVRAHTDLAVPRACIELFLRDEAAHARLGVDLLPDILAHHEREVGASQVARDVEDELRATFQHLDLVVGLDAQRRGISLHARPQPTSNPGVIEPALDALALYAGVERTLAPRLERLGIDASRAWTTRWSGRSGLLAAGRYDLPR